MFRCAGCGAEWVRGDYAKYKISSLVSPYTARKAFPHLQDPSNQRICGLCRIDLTRRTIYKRSTNKRTWPVHSPKRHQKPTKVPPSECTSTGGIPESSTSAALSSTPSQTTGPSLPASTGAILQSSTSAASASSFTPTAAPSLPESPEPSFKDRAKAYIDASQYGRAFRALISNSSAAKTALHNVAVQEVKREMARTKPKGTNPITSLRSHVTTERIEAFSWNAIYEEARAGLPFLVRVLEVAMPSPRRMAKQVTRGPPNKKRHLSEDEGLQKRNARLAVILGIVFYSRNPREYKFIQSIMSVDLWLQGASKTNIRSLNFLGMSQGVDAAWSNIDNIKVGSEQKAVRLRLEAEASYSQKPPRRRTYDRPAGYSVSLDTAQLKVHRKHYGTDASYESYISSLAYATSHRVRAAPLLLSARWSPSPATDLNIAVFLPADPDFQLQRADLVTTVKRTLVLHLSAFDKCKKRIAWTTPHAYTDVMRTKSDIVSLGVIQGNSSATADATGVLDNLRAHVPVIDNCALAVPCHGDVETIDTVIRAKQDRVSSCAQRNLFQPLKEIPQEFHKEVLLMQDVMDTFFTPESRTDRGTLHNIKDQFQLKSARSQVMNNFQHVWDLLMLATEGMTVLLAMKFMGITDPDDIPDDLPDVPSQLDSYLERLAASIVDRVWQQPSKEDIHRAGESYRTQHTSRDVTTSFPYCRCHTEKDDMLVRCCNSKCQYEWLHLSCLDPPLENAPPAGDDWYCSTACEHAAGYIYCTCKSRRSRDIDMVQCTLKENCHRYEWYHPSCLGQASVDEFPEEWYCSDQCALAEQEDDGVLQYSLDLLWAGLNLAVRRSAVQEGDGVRMLTYWRLDMLQFWKSNHPKYLKTSHTLLAYTGGFLSPAIAHEIMWNRTVNICGGDSGNIGLDQMNKLFNKEFKEKVKHCHGRYTPILIQKCSQMFWPFRQELNRLLQFYPDERRHGKGDPKYREDVSSFLHEYVNDGLFDYCPPRSHSAFPNYTRETGKLRDPVHFGEQLKELSIQLDNYREMESTSSASCDSSQAAEV